MALRELDCGFCTKLWCAILKENELFSFIRTGPAVLIGPPGAIGEKFTVSQHGHEDVSHEQRPLYLGKQRVVQYGLSCTYGCTAVLLRTISM